MKIEKVSELTAFIVCDCGLGLCFKRFQYQGMCYKCGKVIPIADMVSEWIKHNQIIEEPKKKRGRKPKQEESVQVLESKVDKNIFRFKGRYDFKKIAKVAKKYRRDK